ncbi:MAG: DUF5596 domain-containing protein [Clostridia bacterium]|nr:DUF5596 domain-containing protein [Clostridia bacterium]MBR6602554.1 DUF5596 domain-containing protein [Clostridia bacterium]
MLDFLVDFLDRFDYPQEAKKAFYDCYNALMADGASKEVVNKHLENYSLGNEYNHDSMLYQIKTEATRIGIPWQTAQLLMVILLSKYLKEKYKEKGIEEQVWVDTVGDFKCKLYECHKVYHIWGSFVGWWWKDFFSMKIFALGRLQYEMKLFDKEYKDENVHLTPDMKAISIHIPSSGPLTKELREDSYRRAKEFFKDYFGDQPTLFMCSSWLLFPAHEEMIPKSNIVDFMHDFNIFESTESEKFGELWRIFDDKYSLPYEELPRDTSMRRAYAERLCAGKKLGKGIGFFIR